MKPVCLEMQAFGPYVGKQTIDFSKLCDAQVYLICGDTGAGKTTIFDAIVYALYGCASGDARTDAMLRSKYADTDCETCVRFTFLHNGQMWRIIRKPTQELKKLRGQGTRTVLHSVELTCPDGSVITRVEQARSRIVETLGLTREQFMQVVMIAQGDFQHVIRADTPTRQAILRSIFGTGFYNRLVERIQTDYKEAKDLAIDLRRRVSTREASIRVRDDHPMRSEALAAKTQCLPDADVLEVLRLLNQWDEDELNTLRQEEAGLEERLQEARVALDKAMQRDRLSEDIKRLTDQEASLAAKQTAEQVDLTAARQAEPRIRQLRDMAAAVTERLPRYDEADRLEKDAEQAAQQTKAAEAAVNSSRGAVASLAERLSKARDEMNSLLTVGDRLREAERRLEGYKADRERLRLAEKALADRDRCARDAEEAARLYRKAAAAYEQRNAAYERMLRQTLDAQAGHLAARLREGEPCPVCGSIHHPAPAVLSGEAASDEDLSQAKADMDEALGIQRTRAQVSSSREGMLTLAETALAEALTAAFGEVPEDAQSALCSASQRCDSHLRETEKELNDLEKARARLAELQENIPRGEQRQREAEAEALTAEKTLTGAQIHQATLMKQLNECRSELNPPTRQEALAEQALWRQEADRLEDVIRQGEQKLADTGVALAGCRGSIAAAAKEIGLLPPYETKVMQAEHEALSKKRAEHRAVMDTRSTDLNSNKDLLRELEVDMASLTAAEARRNWLEKLHMTASGLISTRKIDLETYVQLHLFDRVLFRANQRLRSLIGGQYTLVRAERQQGGRDSSLELDIIDSWNGTKRSVNSLSGGETFKASLSLALGFSDEIQSNAGGVQLDVLFIDEGFGSLDEDSLNQAIGVLRDLSGGSRQVGIISHVGDLKRRIDRRIVVHKQPGLAGSRAEIE